MIRITLKKSYEEITFTVPNEKFTKFLSDIVCFLDKPDDVQVNVTRLDETLPIEGEELRTVLREIGEEPLTKYGEGLGGEEEGSSSDD